jgi:hypothetical protein
LPRLRRKADAFAALAAQAPGAAPKRHDPAVPLAGRPADQPEAPPATLVAVADPPDNGPADSHLSDTGQADLDAPASEADESARDDEEGPVHRPLIRASLPRVEGAPPPARPATDFTIRQPAGRQNRFRPRHTGGGQPQGNRSGGHMGGGGPLRGGMPRHGGGHPQVNRMANRHGQGRKRSK